MTTMKVTPTNCAYCGLAVDPTGVRYPLCSTVRCEHCAPAIEERFPVGSTVHQDGYNVVFTVTDYWRGNVGLRSPAPALTTHYAPPSQLRVTS